MNEITQIWFVPSFIQREDESLSELDKCIERNVFGLIHLIRLIAEQRNSITNLQLVLFSKFAYDVCSLQTHLNPEYAMFDVLGKVLGREYYNIRCRYIDMDDFCQAEDIFNELIIEVPPYKVAYRKNNRYIEKIDRVDLKSDKKNVSVFKDNGVYIITGGTGRIGLVIAKYIANHKKGTILLVNRTKLPERNIWEKVIRQGEDKQLCHKLSCIIQIERAGANVELVDLDITDSKKVDTFLKQCRSKYGKINGIVHCAGVGVGMKGELLQEDSDSVFEAVMAPKVQGTWILDHLTRDDQLDFFVMFTSVATLTGSIRGGSYVVANGYQNGYAEYRNQIGHKTFSITLPAMMENEYNHYLNPVEERKQLFEPISEQELSNVFELVLNSDYKHIIIGKIKKNSDIFLLKDSLYFEFSGRVLQELQIFSRIGEFEEEQKVELPTVVLKGRASGIYSRIEILIGSILKKYMGYKEINILENFFELGGDSIIAMKVINDLNAKLGSNIKITELLAHPSISEFAQSVQRSYKTINRIQPVFAENGCFPVTPAQKRMIIVNEIAPESISYNEPLVFLIEGKLNIVRIEYAINQMLKKNEILRTSFQFENNEPIQIVQDEVTFNLNQIDLSNNIDLDTVIKDFVRPFNLNDAPLFRVALVRTAELSYVLLLDMHHIITDGVSAGLFVEQLFKIYQGEKLSEPKLQYKDYSVWYYEYLQNNIAEQANYWLEIYKIIPPVLQLPYDNIRPCPFTYQGDRFVFNVSNELSDQISRFARLAGTTRFIVLMSAFSIILSRYSGQEDIVVGTPVSGRHHENVEGMLGMFVNTLAIRTKPLHEISYDDFIKQIKESVYLAFENQDYPFETLISELHLIKDLSRNPLFDVMFIMHNIDVPNYQVDSLIISKYNYSRTGAKFDLTLECDDRGEEMRFVIEYCTDLFQESTIQRMARHYQNILQAITSGKRQALSDIEIMDEQEYLEQKRWNQTVRKYPGEKCIYELFEEQVRKTPDRCAIECCGRTVSYRKLNQKANQLRSWLNECGVCPGDVVAIETCRDENMIIILFGVMKAGGICLPISESDPKERKEEIGRDSGTKYWLKAKQGILVCNGCQITMGELEEYSGEDEERKGDSEDIAYLIYTSGSTGTPKGVALKHRGIINHAYCKIGELGIVEADVISHNLNIHFVASIWQYLSGLYTGGKVVIYDEETVRDAYQLIKRADEDEVTILEVIPSQLMTYCRLLEEGRERIKLEHLRKLVLTGEEVRADLVERFYQYYDIELINAYGQSECSDDTFHYHIPREWKGYRVPIGKPGYNTRAYVLSESGRQQPVGVAGELYIAGDGLGAGYWQNEKLTGEKYVSNTFEGEGLLFRTGDVVKWQEDGNLVYLGRKDKQIKIRGYRIEIGEIEAALEGYGEIEEAVVTIEEGEEREVEANIVARRGIDYKALKRYLRTKLPGYMVPSRIYEVTEIPRNTNGKVDRLTVREKRKKENLEWIGMVPEGEMELQLAEIWKELLGREIVGAEEDFFAAGGDSLKAVTLAHRISKSFSIEIELKDIFENPTIKDLSRYIGEAKGGGYEEIPVAEKQEYYDTTPAQKRIYIVSQMDRESTAYNISGAFIAGEKLNKEKLSVALMKLINRHDAFRTSFHLIDGRPVFKVAETISFNIESVYRSGESMEETVENFIRPFKLDESPLLRVGLMELNDGQSLVLLDLHHIIADGISLQIIIHELTVLYQGQSLMPNRIDYKDIAVFTKKRVRNARLEKHKAYWIKEFCNGVPELNLPLDYPRQSERSFKGASYLFTIDHKIAEELRCYASKTKTTLFTILLMLYQILLFRYSQQTEVVIGIPVASRDHPDFQNIVGLFVNTLPLYLKLNTLTSFEENLIYIKDKWRKALENQEICIEDIVQELEIQVDKSRNPLFDTMFILQNIEKSPIDTGIFTSFIDYSRTGAKFDLTLECDDRGEELRFVIEYCTDLFQESTIQRMARHYQNILQAITSGKRQALSDIEIMDEQEYLEQKRWNQTVRKYPGEKCIYELFEEQVRKTPDRCAIECCGRTVSYRKLNQKANQLRSWLNECGVCPGDVVAIETCRDENMIIILFGVMKAGGICLPISESDPKERKEEIGRDSGTKYWLKAKQGILVCNGCQITMGELEEYSGEDEERKGDSEDIAYLIYTSGSTGTPKGVALKHRGIINHAYCKIGELGIVEADVISHNLNIHFVASIWQYLSGLYTGGKVVIYDEETVRDAYQLIKRADEDEVTILEVIPSQLMTYCRLLEEGRERIKLEHLRKLVLTGEEVRADLVERFYQYYDIELINAYGQSECSDDTFHYHIPREWKGYRVPIGKPGYNTRAYVLSESGRQQPVGVAGELYIAGDGLGAGYWQNEKLTGEKYVSNTFEGEGLLFRTGDVVKWQEDGNLVYLGRKDKQIKIRGYRIEIGEIEAALEGYGEIEEAVVTIEEGEEREVEANIVARRGIDYKALKRYLRTKLPGYMVPSRIYEVTEIPRNTNGKVDRLTVREKRKKENLEWIGMVPEGEMELQLAEIWKELLGREIVGAEEDFFAAGGDSLKAVTLAHRISKSFSIEIELKDIFENPTIKDLSRYIGEAKGGGYEEIPVAEKQEYYDTTPAQKRIYIVSQMDRESTAYNISGAFSIESNYEKSDEC